MEGIAAKLTGLVIKLKDLVLKYCLILFRWKIKLVKVQLQKMKRSKELKHLEKAYSGLGAEIFALMKDGATSWQGSPAVANNVARIEEAEARVFQVDAAIEELHEKFRQKCKEIRNKYDAREQPADEEAKTE